MATRKLDVVIVGAGLGGLACAAALRNIANVTVLEGVSEIKELGAAVHVGPSAHRLIKEWGGDLFKYGAVENTSYTEYDGLSGNLRVNVQIPVKQAFGTEWTLNHRVDVQAELHRLATDSSIPGPPALIHLNTRVSEVDTANGIVTAKDGRTFKGDVIIGADGIKSILRAAVVGENMVAKPSKHSAYRMLIPADHINAIPEVKELDLLSKGITIIDGDNRRIITYPCRNRTLLNFVCALPDSELEEISEEKWTAKGDIDALVKSYASFAPQFQALLSTGKNVDIGLWQLRDQDPLVDWVKDRLIIIGDAAHPMLPHQGQGASMAIEDAEALAVCLKDCTPEKVPEALRRAFNVRYKRASEAQRVSRAMGVREQLKNEKGEPVPVDATKFSAFLFSYKGAEDWEKSKPEWVISA